MLVSIYGYRTLSLQSRWKDDLTNWNVPLPRFLRVTRASAVRPRGIACRLKAGTEPGAIGNRGNITLTLTEFSDPNGKVSYFRVPDLSTTVSGELTGPWAVLPDSVMRAGR